jgi:hypothetical protein
MGGLAMTFAFFPDITAAPIAMLVERMEKAKTGRK